MIICSGDVLASLLDICMSEKAFCCFFWKIFSSVVLYRLKVIFFLSVLKWYISIYFLVCLFLTRNRCHSYLFPLYIIFFSLIDFNIVSNIISSLLKVIRLLCIWCSLCVYFGVLWASWICRFIIFIKFIKFQPLFLQKECFSVFFSLFPSRMFSTHILGHAMLPRQLTDVLFVYF